MSFAYFDSMNPRSYKSYDGTTVEDPTSGYDVLEMTKKPYGHKIVAFRVGYELDAIPGTIRLSIPLREVDALEAETFIRSTMMGAVRTHLRPVWAKVGPADVPSIVTEVAFDKVTVPAALEAARYMAWTATNSPLSIVASVDLAVRYALSILCTDHAAYVALCEDANVPSLECKNPTHDERLHA